MFQQVDWNQSAGLFAIAGFVVTFLIFATALWVALRTPRSRIDHLAQLPLSDSSNPSSHE
jgi:hypothetical protein